MRRNHSISPFDVEADEADDVTQQLWGTSRGWQPQPHRTVNGGNAVDDSAELWGDDTTGTLRALRQGVRANAWIMLNQVPLWLEIWRQINGFAPIVSTDADKLDPTKK